MKNVRIYRHAWPVTVTPERLELGFRIRGILDGVRLSKKNPLIVLQSLMRSGFALANFISALRATKLDLVSFDGDFLIVPSIMARAEPHGQHGYADAILVPKSLFSGIPSATLAAFRSASDNDLLHLLRKLPRLPEIESFSCLIAALECDSSLTPTPPILQAIANFVIDIGQPAGVCDAARPVITRVNHHATLPQFCRLLKTLDQIRSSKVPPTDLQAHLDSLEPETMAAGDDRIICSIAKFFATDYLRDKLSYGRKFAEALGLESRTHSRRHVTKVSTDRRYYSAMPHALALVREGKLTCQMSPVLREAAKVVWSSRAVNPHNDFPKIYSSQIADVPSQRELVDPFDLYRMYLLTDPPPTAEDFFAGRISIEQAAIRVMCLLLADGWQRHCGLVTIELQHFSFGTHFQELRITDSKTGPVNQPIPLWALLPADEIAFLFAFLRHCYDYLKLPPSTRLTEIAGLGRFERGRWHDAQKAFVKVMRGIAPEFDDSTHLPRATGLSWAPVRAMVAFHPELLEHPRIARQSAHPWFSEYALARFRQLLSSEDSDSLEIYRRIAGWTTGEQFIKTYCRSAHLLFELHLFLRQYPSGG